MALPLYFSPTANMQHEEPCDACKSDPNAWFCPHSIINPPWKEPRPTLPAPPSQPTSTNTPWKSNRSAFAFFYESDQESNAKECYNCPQHDNIAKG